MESNSDILSTCYFTHSADLATLNIPHNTFLLQFANPLHVFVLVAKEMHSEVHL